MRSTPREYDILLGRAKKKKEPRPDYETSCNMLSNIWVEQRIPKLLVLCASVYLSCRGCICSHSMGGFCTFNIIFVQFGFFEVLV